MEQEDRGAQNAYCAADHHSDYRQVRYRVGYLQFQSRPHAGLKHMELGPKNARYIVHRSFNQGRPIRVSRETDVSR